MKRIISKSAPIGALAGSLSALIYGVIVLLIAEAFLPRESSIDIVIFDKDFLNFFLPSIILPNLLVLIIFSAFLGSIISVIFGVYLEKSKPMRKRYVFICTAGCTLTISPLIILALIITVFRTFFALAYHPIINPFIDSVIELIIPCMVFILTGFITSNYLYDLLNPLNAENSLS
jgi:hypothetical protein